ncbi:hypothetical protein MNB_SV-14-1136 [hydrothermal vent metagenome]|uniref:Uncharacterized protein n=1 Tax=hydrothermal vent metagenome TaxID=652676 RepID=A0A1W1C1N8_9ZZZZ
MYDILVEGVKYKSFRKIKLEYPEDEVFEKYGKFLDNIPFTYKKSVANEILKYLYEYNRSVAMYAKQEEINEERKKHGLKEMPKKKNEAYNKIKKDLAMAENFRETLESFEEMAKRKGLTSVLNTNDNYLSPHQEKLADFIMIKKKELLETRTFSDPYYRMVQLVDEYIQDLSNYTMLNEELKIGKMDKYIDSYPKPNRGKLRKYLLEVCKIFRLKNCVNNAKELIKQLNKNC